MAELNWSEMIDMTAGSGSGRPICIALHGINDTLNEILEELKKTNERLDDFMIERTSLQ